MTGDMRSSILTTAAVAASVAGLTVIQPLAAAPPLLLAALLMEGDSADSAGGVADAIQGNLLPGNSKTVIVNFLTGPFGIWNALDETEDPQDLVPSTTLGAANGMPFIGPQQVPGQIPPAGPTQTQPPLWPLEPILSPILSPVIGLDPPDLDVNGLNPMPLPGFDDGPVVTSYEYDFNAYAPASLLNPFALTNSFAAYLDRALDLDRPVVPLDPDGVPTVCEGSATCTIDGRQVIKKTENGVTTITFINPDGTSIVARIETRDGRTYVTYDDDGPLPLVRPLRDYGGLLGNELADIIEPALTALVYWGYRDATGTGSNGLLPSTAETIRAVLDFVVGVKQGLESLFKPHLPPPATVAPASPVPEDTAADLDARPDELRLDPTSGSADESETKSSLEPPKPFGISVEDALNQLTEIFKQQPETTPETVDEAPVDEAPVDEAPVDEAPVDEAPVDEAPADEAPVDEAPVDEAPVDDSPSGDIDENSDEDANDTGTDGDSAAGDADAHPTDPKETKGDNDSHDNGGDSGSEPSSSSEG